MFAKIFSKFVTPWVIFKVEREGRYSRYVYARKVFGKLQYLRHYGRDVNEKAKVSSTTFIYDYAHKFDELRYYNKDILAELNLPAKARKLNLKLTKVEPE